MNKHAALRAFVAAQVGIDLSVDAIGEAMADLYGEVGSLPEPEFIRVTEDPLHRKLESIAATLGQCLGEMREIERRLGAP